MYIVFVRQLAPVLVAACCGEGGCRQALGLGVGGSGATGVTVAFLTEITRCREGSRSPTALSGGIPDSRQESSSGGTGRCISRDCRAVSPPPSGRSRASVLHSGEVLPHYSEVVSLLSVAPGGDYIVSKIYVCWDVKPVSYSLLEVII